LCVVTQSWEQQAEGWSADIEHLLATLRESPALRYFVVGVDAASLELGCPPRALKAAFSKVRAYNRSLQVVSSRPCRLMNVTWLCQLVAESAHPDTVFDVIQDRNVAGTRLGITLHVGEDFIDPVTGLRHIWEA